MTHICPATLLGNYQKFNSIDKPSVKDDCFALLNEMSDKAVKCRYIDFNPLNAVDD